MQQPPLPTGYHHFRAVCALSPLEEIERKVTVSLKEVWSREQVNVVQNIIDCSRIPSDSTTSYARPEIRKRLGCQLGKETPSPRIRGAKLAKRTILKKLFNRFDVQNGDAETADRLISLWADAERKPVRALFAVLLLTTLHE